MDFGSEKITDKLAFLEQYRHYLFTWLQIKLSSLPGHLCPGLEFGVDKEVFCNGVGAEGGSVIHIGVGAITENDPDKIILQVLYYIMREAQSYLSTPQKYYEWAINNGAVAMADEICKAKYGTGVTAESLSSACKRLCADGENITEDKLKAAAAIIVNSVETGRIEDIASYDSEIFWNEMRLFRSAEYRGYSTEQDADAPTFVKLANTIYCLATMGQYPQNYFETYFGTEIDDIIVNIVSSLNNAIEAESCKDMALNIEPVFRKLAPYVGDYIKYVTEEQIAKDNMASSRIMMRRTTSMNEQGRGGKLINAPHHEQRNDSEKNSKTGNSDTDSEIKDEEEKKFDPIEMQNLAARTKMMADGMGEALEWTPTARTNAGIASRGANNIVAGAQNNNNGLVLRGLNEIERGLRGLKNELDERNEDDRQNNPPEENGQGGNDQGDEQGEESPENGSNNQSAGNNEGQSQSGQNGPGQNKSSNPGSLSDMLNSMRNSLADPEKAEDEEPNGSGTGSAGTPSASEAAKSESNPASSEKKQSLADMLNAMRKNNPAKGSEEEADEGSGSGASQAKSETKSNMSEGVSDDEKMSGANHESGKKNPVAEHEEMSQKAEELLNSIAAAKRELTEAQSQDKADETTAGTPEKAEKGDEAGSVMSAGQKSAENNEPGSKSNETNSGSRSQKDAPGSCDDRTPNLNSAEADGNSADGDDEGAQTTRRQTDSQGEADNDRPFGKEKQGEKTDSDWRNRQAQQEESRGRRCRSGETAPSDATPQEVEEYYKKLTESCMDGLQNRLDEIKNFGARQQPKIKEYADTTAPVTAAISSKLDMKATNNFQETKRNYPLSLQLPDYLAQRAKAFKEPVRKILEKDNVPTLDNLTSGKVSRDNTWKLAVGENDFFCREEEEGELDTCIYFLIDNSGSTGHGTKSVRDYMWQTMSVFEEGFKEYIPIKIVAFEASGAVKCHHECVKSWEERYNNSCSHNFNVQGPGGCGNSDEDSLIIATAELLKRPESKKILVIMSDGGVCSVEQTRRAADQARAQGILLVPILVSCDTTKDGDVNLNSYDAKNFLKIYRKDCIINIPEKIEQDIVPILSKKILGQTIRYRAPEWTR